MQDVSNNSSKKMSGSLEEGTNEVARTRNI